MAKVYLVGAGCGALDLYTLKALECIQKADCIIYDSLIDQAILSEAKKNAEKIHVGKRANHHTLPQEEINALLIQKAQEYENVVRLKGGDVYVFGRGGEEGKALYEAKIDFEVVPGVSSCTAGLAYAGIPVTHRGLSKGFMVFTSVLENGNVHDFDFKMMQSDDYTYIFLMSIGKLEYIVEGLLKAHKNPQTKIALISKATSGLQDTLVGTLENIVSLQKERPIQTPGLIVVGDVVGQRKYLNFFEKKALFQKRILVVSLNNDHKLYHALSDLAADVIEVQVGEMEYLHLDSLKTEGKILFTSQHGVHAYFENYLRLYKDIRHLNKAHFIVIGEKTKEALASYHIKADEMPSLASSDDLFKEIDCKGAYWYTSDYSYDHKEVQRIVIYQNKEIDFKTIEGTYDYAFFTAASAYKRFSQNNQANIKHYVSIGPKTSQAILNDQKDASIIESEKASKIEMIQCVLRREERCSIEEED